MSKQKNRIKDLYICLKGKAMSTILNPRIQNPKTQTFVHKYTVILFGGKALIEVMESYLKYVFNPLSMNVDSGCCRNINVVDSELLTQLLLSCYVQYREDHVTFLKCES